MLSITVRKKLLNFSSAFGSEEEAKVAQTQGKLSFKPGTKGPDGGRKWISLPGKASPKNLGQKLATHAWKMEIETKPGTRDWLKQIKANYKPNEPHFFGIPTEHLPGFN